MCKGRKEKNPTDYFVKVNRPIKWKYSVKKFASSQAAKIIGNGVVTRYEGFDTSAR